MPLTEFIDDRIDAEAILNPEIHQLHDQLANANSYENVVEMVEHYLWKRIQSLKKDFPPGVDYEINYDVSKFVDASIEKVLHTLLEAFILVALVVFIFLGDWRSTLIPILAVPVSLIGAFICMQMFGLSINLITLLTLSRIIRLV